MAFPSIRSEATGTQTSDSSSWTAVAYPATVVAGDLLALTIGMDGASTVAASGFAVSKTLVNGTACRNTTLTKVADGTETGTFTVTVTGGAEQGAWRCVAYQNWFGTVATGVAFSTGATGTASTPSTNMPNPDTLTPSWGAADTFWQAIAAADDGRTSFTAFPTNYTLSQFDDASGGPAGSAMGSAGREFNAASDDPGTFTISRSVAWAAYTMAIRPAAAPPPGETVQRRILEPVNFVPVHFPNRW